MLPSIDDIVIAIQQGRGLRACPRRIIGEDIVRSDLGLRVGGGQERPRVVQKIRQVTLFLILRHAPGEEAEHLPGLVKGHREAQVAARQFLPHQAQGHDIGAGPAVFLREGQEPQPQPIALFDRFPGKGFSGIRNLIALQADRENVPVDEFPRLSLQ